MAESDTPSTPPVPQDSATIVVLRPAGTAIELFCVKRHMRSGVLGGAIVFPGGKVDPADWSDEFAELTETLSPRALAMGGAREPEREARALAVAALRELLEEAAILPAQIALNASRTLELREALRANGSSPRGEARVFADVLRSHGLKLATHRLEALWRWITPEAESRRYDARFYVLELPEGQSGQHDDHETTHSFWATPQEILERWRTGELMLAPPTFCTVELFSSATTVAEAIAIARRQRLDPICPVAQFDGQEMVIALPGDPLHPEATMPEEGADPRTRFVLRDGRFIRV